MWLANFPALDIRLIWEKTFSIIETPLLISRDLVRLSTWPRPDFAAL